MPEQDTKNAENEKGKLPETKENIPHGQGAHVNEKEANAQEEYPGPKDDEKQTEEKPG